MGYNVRDIVKGSSTLGTGFLSGSAGITDLCCSGSVWAGDIGSTAYTVGDCVTALKQMGALSA